MKAERLLSIINDADISYFSGVPDSQLSAFTDAIVNKYGFDARHHTVAVNEGCAVGMAAGYHLSTAKLACIYMQNSGLGNAVNPITSLLNREVYGIGCLFVIGWRGQPDTHDEPQHVFMGKITLPLLDILDIRYLVIDETTDADEFEASFRKLAERLPAGESIALVIKKNALTQETKPVYKNEFMLCRENIIESISELSDENDILISTTGKISRELYESRKRQKMVACKEFLTVGSMGHCSSIALAIATNKKNKRIIVLDGDGSVLMHMGSLAAIGAQNPDNLIHVLLDNSAHETVGGIPTVSEGIDFCKIASSAGYSKTIEIGKNVSIDEAKSKLAEVFSSKAKGSVFVRIPVALGSRADLGRPKEKAVDNKRLFMEGLK